MNALRDALAKLLDACLRSDAENPGEMVTELEYQFAITEAKAALEATKPAPPQLSPEARWPFPVKQNPQ